MTATAAHVPLADRHGSNDRTPGRSSRRSLDRGRLRHGLVVAVIVAGGGACGLAAETGFIGVAAIGAVLAGILVLARPHYAAVVAVGLVLSNAPVILTREHGLPGAVALVIPLLLAVTLAHRLFVLRESLVLPRAVAWTVALIVVQIIAALASRDPERSVSSVQTFLVEGFVLYVLVVNVLREHGSIRAAAFVLVVVAGLLGSLSLVKEATGDRSADYGGFASMSAAVIGGDDEEGAQRHAGPIGEQNRWAQTLAMVLPLGIALAASDRSKSRRVIATAATFGIAAGIVFTYSRGAAVGLAMTGLGATLVGWVRPRTALIAAVLTVGAATLVAPTYVARTTTVFGAMSSLGGTEDRSAVDDKGTDGSISNRAVEGKAALDVFLRKPVFGVGPDLFSSYFQDEARAQGADRIVGVERQAHSLYLGLAAETGLAGILVFAAVVVAIIGPLARLRRETADSRPDVSGLAAGAALGVVTYLTTGLFLHASYIRFFWLVAAVATALGVAADRDRTVPPPSGRRPDPFHHEGGHHAEQTTARPT